MKLKTLIIISMLTLFFAACTKPAVEPVAPLDLKGSVTVKEKNGIKIHTYLSNSLQATHIIENEKSLVLIDAQFLVPFAKEFRAYADSLGKPIERVIISHGHPDHFFGLGAAFKDMEKKVYALKGTQQFIKKVGPVMLKNLGKKLGKAVPEELIVPTHVIEIGAATIDGVNYEFERFLNGEAQEQLLIKLPDLGILIVQDLAFNGLHLFMGNNTFDDWIVILESLQKIKNYDTVLVGHGKPGDTSIFATNIAYLKDVKRILATADNANAFKTQLLKKYPGLGGKRMIDISTPRLFKNQ